MSQFLTNQNFRRRYVQNEIICGNCNGAGLQGYMDYCRACGGSGIESFNEFMRNNKGDVLTLTMTYYQFKKLLQS